MAQVTYQIVLVSKDEARPDTFGRFWLLKVLDAQWLAVIISPVITFWTFYLQGHPG